MNLDRYLGRIGILEMPDTSPASLARLQAAHLTNIPYETLDITRGVPFTLDLPSVYEKIVERGRGGYCFELNGLFSWMLSEIGFTVTEHFARFLRDAAPGIPMRRHRVLRVTAADGCDYLADVGVGGVCPLVPLPIVFDTPFTEQNGTWRMVSDPFYGTVVQERKNGEWRPYYAFTDEAAAEIDFLTTDYWCQSAPDSPFRKNPIVSIQTATGRKTIRDGEFRVFDGDTVSVTPIENDTYERQILEEIFNIRF